MNLLCYGKADNALHERLCEKLAATASFSALTVNDHEIFMDRLKKCPCHESVILFSVDTPEDILFLHQVRERLFGARLILMISEEQKELVQQCYALYPRLILYQESDTDITASVILKMMTRNGSSPHEPGGD